MNIKQIEKKLTKAGIEGSEAKVEAKMLVKHFLNFSDNDLVLNEKFDESPELKEAINKRVKNRTPIQYILGSAHFMGEDFIVNESVLIPRDDTEILVRKAVDIIKYNNFRKILDIGTGSGCIGCMIAKLTGAQVIGVDISTDALQVALSNSEKLGLCNKAIFRKSDLFSNIRKEREGSEKFDIIISNPPYIPISEKENIQTEVGFEPESALYANDADGIEFYEKIVADVPKYLREKGYLIFELGIGQADKVKSLMEEHGLKSIEILNDLAGIERVIVGKR